MRSRFRCSPSVVCPRIASLNAATRAPRATPRSGSTKPPHEIIDFAGAPVSRMIALQINGRRVELEEPTALLNYLEKLGVSPRAVAVEHNAVIIERSRYAEATLDDGAVPDIALMVAGVVYPRR